LLSFYSSSVHLHLHPFPTRRSSDLYYTFLTLHLEALGYARGWIGALWALGVIAEIVLFLLMARLLARFSLKQLLVASFVLAALRWLLLGWLAADLALL